MRLPPTPLPTLWLALLLLCTACSEDPATVPAAPPPAAAGQAPAATGHAPAGGPRLPDEESYEQRFVESRFFIQRDMFLSADQPRLVQARVADFLIPTDEVLGFVLGDEARAYDIRMLSYHHVVNDTIGEQPIAVTY